MTQKAFSDLAASRPKISISEQNEMHKIVEASTRLQGGAGIGATQGRAGLRLFGTLPGQFLAVIQCRSGIAYAWHKVVELLPGADADGFPTLSYTWDPNGKKGNTLQWPAFEINFSTNVVTGTIVRMWLGESGDHYRFMAIGSGGGSAALTTTSPPDGGSGGSTLTSGQPSSSELNTPDNYSQLLALTGPQLVSYGGAYTPGGGSGSGGAVTFKKIQPTFVGGDLNYYRHLSNAASYEAWYTTPAVGATTMTLTHGYDGQFIWLTPFIVVRSTAFNEACCRFVSTTGSAPKVRLGVYAAKSDKNLYPDCLVAQTGEITAQGSSQPQQVKGAMVVMLHPGIFWLAFRCDNFTGSDATITGLQNCLYPIMGYDPRAGAGSFMGQVFKTTAAVDLKFPDSFPADATRKDGPAPMVLLHPAFATYSSTNQYPPSNTFTSSMTPGVNTFGSFGGINPNNMVSDGPGGSGNSGGTPGGGGAPGTGSTPFQC